MGYQLQWVSAGQIVQRISHAMLIISATVIATAIDRDEMSQPASRFTVYWAGRMLFNWSGQPDAAGEHHVAQITWNLHLAILEASPWLCALCL